MKLIKKYYLLAVLILLLLPSIWYLFVNGFIKTDDGDWMIIRFSAFYQALRDGQFPVRFLGRLNFGYGYPVANFLYPGFMYLAVPFKALGLSFVDSIKVILGFSMVGSGLFTYFWLRKLFDGWSSLFASIFYVYIPYHLFDITKRGSVGEVLSLAVVPFIFWQIEQKNVVLSSIGIALLILSHNTLAILFLPIVILYMGLSIYVSKKRTEMIRKYFAALLLGLGMSTFFWIPALLELPYTIFSQTKISDYSQYFADYNLIGIVTLVIFVTGLGFFIYKPTLIKNHRLTLIFFVLGILSILLASSLTAFLWQILPVSFIQFPFRFLSLTIVCATFVFAFVTSQITFKFRMAFGILIIAVTLYFSKNLLVPKEFSLKNDSFYSTNEATTTVADEYMPLWVKAKPQSHFNNKVVIVRGEGSVENTFYNSKQISFNFLSDSPSVVRISTIYYPGWTAYSNQGEKAIFYNNDQGLVDMKLTSADKKITLVFGETSIRVIADIVTLASLLFVMLLMNARMFRKIIFIKIKI